MRPARCVADAFEIHVFISRVVPRSSQTTTFCPPRQTTSETSGSVTDDSAAFVAAITFVTPSSGAANA